MKDDLTIEDVAKIVQVLKDCALNRLEKLFYFDRKKKSVFCRACGIEIPCRNETEMVERAIEHITEKITEIYWGLWHLDMLIDVEEG